MLSSLHSRLKKLDSLDWRPQLFLLAVLSLMLLPWLGDILFNSKGEPREAIVAVSILDSGNWILPTSFGHDIPYKPPFLAWLIAVFSLLFNGGEVNEYLSRLPSALAYIALCWGTFRWVAHVRGWRFAMIVALMLATSVEVFRAGIACRVDMVLTVCSVLSVFILDRGRGNHALWRYVAAVLLLSCATLTKGPVGTLLPCLVAWVYFLLAGERFWPTLGRLSAVCLLSLVIPALWYLAAWKQGGSTFLSLAYEENILRLLGKMPYESHVNPWWYNFLTLAAGLLPWTLLLILVPACLRSRIFNLGRLRRWIRRLSPQALLATTAVVIIVVFYTIPASKRSVYLLPAYPFLAYGLAAAFLKVRGCWPAAVMAWLLSSLSLAAPVAVLLYGVAHDTHISELGIVTLLPPLVCGAWWVLRRDRPVWSAVLCAAALYMMYAGAVGPMVLNPRSDRDVAMRLATERPTGHIYQLGNLPGQRAYTLNYYLHDRVLPCAQAPSQAPAGSRMIVLAGTDTTGLAAAGWSRPDTVLTRSCDFRSPLMISEKLR